MLGLLIIQGCTGKEARFRYKDRFYNKTGGFDYKRLPLIKPYELWSTGNLLNVWYCDLKSSANPKQHQLVAQEVFVMNELIVFNCNKGCGKNGNRVPDLFTLLNLKNKSEIDITSRVELLIQIKKINKDINFKSPDDIRFLNIDSVYKSFNNTGKLPWLDEHD